MKNIGFIGAGQMGEAIFSGFLKSGAVSADHIFVSCRTQEKADAVAARYPGVRTMVSADEAGVAQLVDASDIVVIATIPLVPAAVLNKLVSGLSSNIKLIGVFLLINCGILCLSDWLASQNHKKDLARGLGDLRPLDALIVGVANAVFMALMGMQYIGLISVVVAVTNLIPTFGPIIGGAVGGFILLLVQPVHALIFIAFTFVLQFLDPYFIKPKLFGNTLGVSGLLILMSVLVCGRIWGIPGILIAIPLAAIVDFVYSEGILTALEKRKKDRQKKQPEAASE